MINFKQILIQHYNHYLNERVNTLREMIVDLTEDSLNDAKGSAGDKHETGLAMMHLEQEKLNRKLQEVVDMQSKFIKIDYSIVSNQVILGSLVSANETYFLISVSLPKIEIEGKYVFGVSPEAPLAQKMLGAELNDIITVNQIDYLIRSIE
jgi:transcription elongation GreA/GreB family factor